MGALVYFGIPSTPGIISPVSDPAFARATAAAGVRAGLICLVPAALTILYDASFRMREVWTGRRRSKTVAVSSDAIVLEKLPGPPMHCWQTHYCRPAVRELGPRFTENTPCWRRKEGCFCEEQIALRAAALKEGSQGVYQNVRKSLDNGPRRRNLSPAEKRQRCRVCPIYAEHQRFKYKILVPTVFVLTGALMWFSAGWLKAGVDVSLKKLDALIKDKAEDTLLWGPIKSMPEDFSSDDKARLTAAYREMIEGQAMPAFRKLRTFIAQEKGRNQMVSHVYDVTYGQMEAGETLVVLDDSIVRGTTLKDSIIKILARLNHPNITPLVDSGIAGDGTCWLAMPLVEGERIDRWCDAHAPDAHAIVRLYLQVCSAVAYAHRNLVIHRDIKPSNVLVDDAGHARLLDFGIGQFADAAGERTHTLWRALTPGYAAPEQLRGAPPGTAMDVYGLGALLHRLLTGRTPQSGAADGQATARPSLLVREASDAYHRHYVPLKSDLDRVLLKALAEEPEQRYATADALADDLRRWLDGLPVLAQKPGLAYRARKFAARNRVGVVASVLLAISLAAGVTATPSLATVAATIAICNGVARTSRSPMPL